MTKRILLIDDDTGILDLFKEILQGEGYDVVTGTHGSLAIREAENFDLILLDIKMPKMDGLQCCSILRRLHPSVPVCFLTSVMDVQFRERAYAMGATCYFNKPISEIEIKGLLESVRAILFADKEDNADLPLAIPSVEAENQMLANQVIVDTTSAFIHKLNNEFANITLLVRDLGLQASEFRAEHRDNFEVMHKKVLGALDSTRYLLQRFRNTMGRHPGTFRPIDLFVILQDVKQHLAGRFDAKLAMHLPDRKCIVAGDYELLWHLFENLIRNAMEAVQGRPNGEVRIGISIANAPLLEISVQDNGVGISLDDIARVFELNFTTKPKGLGVGLYLVKRAAQIHGGQVECQSEPNKGTTFKVTLPLKENFTR